MIKNIEMSVIGNIRIEKMHISELEEVAILLTDAFDTNPAYSLIFNQSGKPNEGLFWLFKTSLFLINRRKPVTRVVKEKGSNKIIGAYSLIPPEGVKNSISDYLHIGLPKFILKFGLHNLRKMMNLNTFNKETLQKSIGAKKYYYLSMVAINKEYRGKGIGTFLVRNCLEALAEQGKNCQLLALTTQLPENVVFYSRLGFNKIDEGYLNYRGNKYYNCNMKFNLD